MYAVIQDRGHQYHAKAGDKLTIDRHDAEVGASIEMPLLLVADNGAVKVGAPFVAGGKAVLKVVEHTRGEKGIYGMFKRRKHSHKRRGFRADQTVVEVVAINA
jgi:large subunit ribosomal protein L21